MSTLTRAIVLAAQHHDGQTDKGGHPYILHPLRLMLQASTDEERIVALLHDVVEDTALTLDDLRCEGFSKQIVEAIDRLTRRPGESYDQFIERIKGNDLARRVKILDLEDNSDLSRIPNPSEVDKRRLEKYRKALSVLRDQKGE
jgi:(p)ppGpp synthase/HD superfamily hydrolase